MAQEVDRWGTRLFVCLNAGPYNGNVHHQGPGAHWTSDQHLPDTAMSPCTFSEIGLLARAKTRQAFFEPLISSSLCYGEWGVKWKVVLTSVKDGQLQCNLP